VKRRGRGRGRGRGEPRADGSHGRGAGAPGLHRPQISWWTQRATAASSGVRMCWEEVGLRECREGE